MGVSFAVAILNRKFLFKSLGRMTELVNTCYKLMKPKECSFISISHILFYFIFNQFQLIIVQVVEIYCGYWNIDMFKTYEIMINRQKIVWDWEKKKERKKERECKN